MILNTIFIGFVIIKNVYAKSEENFEDTTTSYIARVDNFKEQRNRQELSRIVDILNRNAEPKRHGRSDLISGYPDVRIHLIRNPEVLEEFMRKLRKNKQREPIDDSSDSGSIERRLRVVNGDIRRNAEFREEDHGSNDEKEDVDAKPEIIDIDIPSNILESIESQVTPFKPRMEVHEEKPLIENKPNNPTDDVRETTKRFRVKKQKTSEKWDKKDDYKKDRDRKDSKVNRGKDIKDTWDVKDKTEDTGNGEFINNDDWGMAGNSKKEHFLKTDDDEETWNPVKIKRVVKKKDIARSRKQKDMFESKEISRSKKGDKPRPQKRQEEKVTRWEESEKGAGSVAREERTTRRRKVKDVDNDWDVGRNYGKSKKESTWEKPRNSYKQKKPAVSYEKPSYRPRIQDYHKKDRGFGSFQGRTPIPFVGRQGIYDDEK